MKPLEISEMPGWSLLINLDEQILEFPTHPVWAKNHITSPMHLWSVHSTVWDAVAKQGVGDEFWEWAPEL